MSLCEPWLMEIPAHLFDDMRYIPYKCTTGEKFSRQANYFRPYSMTALSLKMLIPY